MRYCFALRGKIDAWCKAHGNMQEEVVVVVGEGGGGGGGDNDDEGEIIHLVKVERVWA